MLIPKGTYITLVANFGSRRNGKTVQYQVLNYDLTVKQDYTASGVIELGGGIYGVRLSFSEIFSGYVRFKEVEDDLILLEPISVVDDFISKIATIFSVETGKWEIVANQMLFYNEADEEILRFDLFDDAGNPTSIRPFKRVPA